MKTSKLFIRLVGDAGRNPLTSAFRGGQRRTDSKIENVTNKPSRLLKAKGRVFKTQ